jgi:hypothetical protein
VDYLHNARPLATAVLAHAPPDLPAYDAAAAERRRRELLKRLAQTLDHTTRPLSQKTVHRAPSAGKTGALELMAPSIGRTNVSA